MKALNCYQTSDGLLFEDEDKAQAHEDALIGDELDEFFWLHFEIDTSRSDIYKGLLKVLKNKKALAATCRKILTIIDYSG